MKSTKKPKIGIFTRPIDQGTSGSGSHLKQLVNQLLQINNKFHIILIHYSQNDNDIYKKTEELIIPKNPLLAHLKLKKKKFDVLHYYPLTIMSPVWLRKPKKVTTIHGGGAAELYFPQQYSKLKRLHAKYIKPLYYKRIDYFFVGAKASKKFLTRQFNVDSRKVFFTYSAVSEDFRVYKDKPKKVLKKYGIDGSFIFHLSKFSERKNPWTLLKAFQIVRESYKGVKLVLGGKGWKNKEILDFSHKHGIFKDVIFTGFIPRKEVIGLLNNAEVFVFPSFFEGFGIPNLEAMACGCPVITSKAFAIPEIVGDSALVLENNLAPHELAIQILEVLNNDKLRAKLIEKGLERVKSFSWEKSAQTVIDVYEKCLKE